MKGLLKGLRYISQIFVADAKEPEIQIGAPTDVKHVAHIGWDNASVTNPTWMNEFKAQPGASGSGGPEGAGAEPPSLPGGGDGAGAGKAEKPRRTRGKGSGGGDTKRRDGPEGSRRPAKAEEGCEGEASGAAATKQRRRKPKTNSGRSKSGGAASSEPSAAAAAED